MRKIYRPQHYVAMAAGPVGLVIDGVSNTLFMASEGKAGPDLIAGVWFVAIATAVAFTFFQMCIQDRKWLKASLFMLGAVVGSAFSLNATFDRAAQTRDATIEARIQKSPELIRLMERRDQLQSLADRAGNTPEMAELIKKRDMFQRGVTYYKRLYLNEHKDRSGRHNAAACQRKCRQYEQQMKAKQAEAQLFQDKIERLRSRAERHAEQRLARVEARIDELKEKVDGAGVRVAKYFKSVSLNVKADAVGLWTPPLLPLGIFIFANLFCAFGFAGSVERDEFEPTDAEMIDAKADRFIAHHEKSSGKLPTAKMLAERSGLDIKAADLKLQRLKRQRRKK